MNKTTIPTFTEETVTKIIHLCSFGIPKGLGKPEPGQMCIEAIVSDALNLPHDAKPYSCVAAFVTKPKIILNDCDWSSNQARAKGMVKLGIAQLGSISLHENQFKDHLRLVSTKRILPYLIQKHYENVKDEKLFEYKSKFKSLKKLDNELFDKFYSYCCDNGNYYDNYYPYFCYHHNHCISDYIYYIVYTSYVHTYTDEFLSIVADTILQTLIDLKSPGCEYLYLVKD